MQEGQRDELEGRHRYSRRPVRHCSIERHRVGRARRAGQARRSGSLGKKVGRESRTWRCAAALHWTLEETREDGTMDRPGLRLLRRHDSLDARAPASLHWARFQYRLESKTRMGMNAQSNTIPFAHI